MLFNKLFYSLRLLAMAAVFASLAGCGLFREERLAAYKTPDCGQSSNTRGGVNYYLLGDPGSLVNWSGCDKSGGGLRNANLNIAWLIGTKLGGADLRGVDHAGAKRAGADLSGADQAAASQVGAGEVAA